MPRENNDLLAIASTCFHLNVNRLIPDYIVIRSPKRKSYAITTLDAYHRNQLAGSADDWLIALNLTSQDIVYLMGLVPNPPIPPDPDEIWQPSPQSPTSTPEIREVKNHASGPQDL